MTHLNTSSNQLLTSISYGLRGKNKCQTMTHQTKTIIHHELDMMRGLLFLVYFFEDRNGGLEKKERLGGVQRWSCVVGREDLL